MQIRTVLCPLDFSDLSYRELHLATSLSRAFGAQLVLHHNITEAGPGAAMSWMWQQEHQRLGREAAAEQRLREIMAEIPAGLEPRAVITHGITAPSILEVQQQVGADLLLLGTHGDTSEDHSSVTESVVAGSHCPVLVLHESGIREPAAALPPESGEPWTVLVTTDLSADSLAGVRYAIALTSLWPLRLHLLHVIESGPERAADSLHTRLEETLYLRLRALLPIELVGEARCHVRFGDPSAEIALATETLAADAIIMGAHAPGLLKRFLTRDTSRQVLRRTLCPVWVVPARWAA